MKNTINSVFLHNNKLYYNLRGTNSNSNSNKKLYRFIQSDSLSVDSIKNTNGSLCIFGPSYKYEQLNNSKINFSKG